MDIYLFTHNDYSVDIHIGNVSKSQLITVQINQKGITLFVGII